MVASDVKPTLLYIYGPPASGKLTVATALAELTGFSLFHNHLSVEAIRSALPFGSEPFTEVLHRLRLDVFQTAARAGISLIFTNNSAWSGPDARSRFAAFATAAKRMVEAEGGRTVFVKVSAPLSVLEERVAHDSRRRLGKLVDIARLRELVTDLDQSALHPDDLEIDTSTVSAEGAALYIRDALGRMLNPSGCSSIS
jgi:chloramphenicol 3-O-phosphotransferase